MEVLSLLLLLGTTVTAREYTDEDLSSFPKLFHLDDYDRCLARKDGLYCLGIFDLTPDSQPNPVYETMKAYSDESYRHFNRTRIHRGTCVSSRCPQEAELNASLRFERCTDKWARARTLRASINTLHYCRTYKDKHTEQVRTPAQQLFLQCVFAIIALNIIGTIYDVYTEDGPNKNNLIAAFSIRANWRRLTIINKSEDPRFDSFIPLVGARVIIMATATYAHAKMFHGAFYIQNSGELEKMTQQVEGIFLSNSTSMIQTFVVVSCFLTCYNLLVFSEKRALSLALLPLCIIKRFIRITPVNLLLVGFAMTWWTETRSGPLVSTTIGLESDACKSKFWSQIFFYNNLVDRANYCITPTWFLAVDMQVYILACILTLIMWRRKNAAIKLYFILFFISIAVIAVIAYINEYKALIFLSTPENIRQLYRDNKSVTEFYFSSWSSIPPCLLGLILANIQYILHEKKIKLSDYKWFMYLYYCAWPALFAWPLKGLYFQEYGRKHGGSRIFHALYTSLERPIYCVIMALVQIGTANTDGPMRRFLSWSGWTILARVSLTVMMLHWCINMSIATRPVAYGSSWKDMVVDWTSTNVITYVLAIPITLLVEIPIQKFFGLLLF